jgi:2-(1,2-epoxy-1,2-dihydrophenyl)acetyl-CoA isomerase
MMSKFLEIKNEGRVRTIILKRPETKNALNFELAWNIIGAVEEAAKDDSVWVVAITGSGDSFCSGLDLKNAGDYSPLSPQDQYLDDIGWVGRIPLVLRQTCDKPVVAGVNGVAAGAGLSLALAADMRIAAKSARFIAGYPRIGASPDGGLTWTLPQLIGYEQAMRFLLENRTVDADEALKLGLVGEVASDDQFNRRLAEYCAFLAERSPITTRLTKRCVIKATAIDLEMLVRLELANIRKAFQSEDSKRAIKAFLEKKEVTFEGR